MNTLYLTYDGLTDPLGQSQVLPYLTGLSKEGFRIDIISFEKAEAFAAEGAKIQAICDASGLNWMPQNYTKTPPVLSTLKDIRKLFGLVKELHTRKDYKLIHCRSYITALAGLHMKRTFGVKFLFDMRGFWADERVDGKLWNLKNPLFKWIYTYFKKKEKAFIEEADAIVSLTHKGKEVLTKWNPKTKSKTVVIPCCVDTTLFDPTTISSEKTADLRAVLGIHPNAFVLTYVGSIGTWYMLDEMLRFFKALQAVEPNSVFLFLTRDSPEHILFKATKEGIDKNNILIKPCSRDEVVQYLTVSSASIFFILPVFSKNASSPTKQGEIMSMGIPIVCNTGIGDTDTVLKKYAGGVGIDLSLPDVHYKGVRELLECMKNFESEAPKEGAREFYGLGNGIAAYQKIYDELCC